MTNTGVQPLSFKDLLTASELTAAEAQLLYATVASIKREPARYASALAGKAAVMLFEKPSLRTRVSFEIGISKLGGSALFYDHAFERIGERESVHDYARNLERWADVIIARTYSHAVIEQFAAYSSVPVINALSDDFHPCQALADLYTLQEKIGPLAGRSLAYIGDGNNVCHSLILLGATLGLNITVVSPSGFAPREDVLSLVQRACAKSGSTMTVESTPEAIAGHDAVYTDVWTSMGHEHEAQARRQTFLPFRVTSELMELSGSGGASGSPALFMHCIPAHRGEEVTDEVIDSPNSIVFDQAENRMHVQNALLLHMLTSDKPEIKTKPAFPTAVAS